MALDWSSKASHKVRKGAKLFVIACHGNTNLFLDTSVIFIKYFKFALFHCTSLYVMD